MNILSAVNVKGSLTLKNGAWISGRKGCSVQGQPGSSIAINNAIVDTTDGCGIGVTNAKLTANNLKFSGSNTPFQRPAVGIQSDNSTVTVTNSVIADGLVGISAQNNSVVAVANTTFPGVEQPIVAGSGSVVTDPATLPPAPAPTGDPAQPGIVCNDIDTSPTCAHQDPPPAIDPPPADSSATVPGDQPPADGTSTGGGATGTGSDSTPPDPLEDPGTGSPDGTTGNDQEADLPLSPDEPPANSNPDGLLQPTNAKARDIAPEAFKALTS